MCLFSASDHPAIIQRSLAVDEPDSSVSSQSENTAEPPEIQIPSDPSAETRREPASAEFDATETPYPSEASAAATGEDEDQSQTSVQDSEVDSGLDLDSRQRRNEESEFEEITSFEARTLEHNDDPGEPAKNSSSRPTGKVWSWSTWNNRWRGTFKIKA